jgi:hypothetical protein
MARFQPQDGGHVARKSLSRHSRRLRVERLESRLLMAADPFQNLLSHGGVCSCPICSGNGLETIVPEQAPTASFSSVIASAGEIGGLPQLSSRPGASATLFLDFDGHVEARWGEFTNVVTRPFDRDGNEASFSASEISSIEEIWARVAEDYAPFNINVTTVAPPSFANRAAVRIAIGGDWRDWFGSSAGGVAYVGGFYNGASNVGYVFEDALGNGTPRYVAEAASHEAGHTFGLLHQATWSGGRLTQEYNRGNSNWAPIMGVGYYSARTTWHNGPTNQSASSLQDDMSVLANSSNGFGYVSDDYGNTTATATGLSIVAGSFGVSGLINSTADSDVFRFTTTGGAANFALNVAQFGANLDSVLQLVSAAGQTLVTASPTTSFGATIATTLASGTYYLIARSSGSYGNVGTYTLTGTVPGSSQAPEVAVEVSGVNLADGGTLSFGSTVVGTPVTRTVTIRNMGAGTLNLGAVSSLPAGFSLVSDIGSTALAGGQSTSFTVRLDAAATGTFSGAISFTTSDSDEGQFDVNLEGSVSTTPATPLVRIIDNGAAGFATSGSWYRQTNVGRERDAHWALRGNGSATATWTFSNLEPGQYRVSGTWPGSIVYATNAPFSVYDGGQLLGTVAVNQERASSAFSDAGSRWQNLGTFTIEGQTLVVRLSNAANDRVVADAIRIERVYSTSAGVISRAAPTHDAVFAFAGGEPGRGESMRSSIDQPPQGLNSRHIVSSAAQAVSVWISQAARHMSPRTLSAREEVFAQIDDTLPEMEVLATVDDLLRDLAAATRTGA